MIGIKRQGGGLPYVPQRDIMNVLPIFGKAAVNCCSTVLESEKSSMSEAAYKSAMEDLDTIMQYYIRLYADGKKDNMAAIQGLRELYEWAGQTEGRKKIFAMYNSFFTTSVYAYMFLNKELMIETPSSMTSEVYENNALATLLTTVDKLEGTQILKSIKNSTLSSDHLNIPAMVRPFNGYIEQIKASQDERYAKMESKKSEKQTETEKTEENK